MAFTLPRRGSAQKAVPRFQIKSSHSARFKIGVSHRAAVWSPPAKDDDRVHERDLRSQYGDAKPRPKRQRG